MPTVLEAFGLRFFFYSDEHTPIHVHVVKGDESAKIELALMCDLCATTA